jgi:predicted nucleic acid-binding Zn ribbon protein
MSEDQPKKRDLAADLFRSYKTGFIKKKKPIEERVQTPGDPTLISNVLNNLIQERDWDSGLAEGTLFATWPQVVGPEIAQHTTPLSTLDGRLLVQCSSTAWATQLNLVGPSLLETIQSSAPGALVESLEFIGPTAPSWKRGLRTISNGRGPRDTYG